MVNSYGNTTSNSATLNITLPPVIKDSIPNQSVCQGQSVTFTANAISNNTLSYQWSNSEGGIPGATNSQFSILNSQLSDYDIYSCNISNGCGIVKLPSFILTVVTAPIITNPEINQTKYMRDSINYSLSPGGTPPFSYQWFLNGNIIPGATNAIYTNLNLSLQDSGVYSCEIKNICDSTLANITHLTVLPSAISGYSISGFVKYDNADSTELKEVIVYLLNSEGIKIDSSVTDTTGFYSFLGLKNNSYTITAICNLPAEGYDPLDALLDDRYYIKDYNITDPVKLHAGDVICDFLNPPDYKIKITPADALLINRKYIKAIKHFKFDWYFETKQVTINGSDIKLNIRGICMGDVNASFPK